MKKTKKKNKKILVVSILLAMLIVAGGTFAWFTSKDEVTNKLSASNNYGVTITENYTPPEQWTPGESVKKEVSVLNTGNIDAFVKLKLKNVIDLTVAGTPETFNASNLANYVEITKDAEKIALQAGGLLVCEHGTALEEETEINSGVVYEPTIPDTISTEAAATYKDGLYIFKRYISETTDSNGTVTRKYEYTGYYRYGTKYYAIEPIEEAESTKISDIISNVKLTTVTKLSNKELTLNYDNVTGDTPYVLATYNVGTDDAPNYIKIKINLDKDELANWTLYDGVFYYNYSLAAGASTGNLITSVTLDSSVDSSAYKSFDYYLTVSMDSAQITSGDGDAVLTAVNAQGWGATVSNYSSTDSSVTWTESTTSATGSSEASSSEEGSSEEKTD
jgi:alternate signal-mediated exported protein